MLKLFGCTGNLMSVCFNWDNWSKVCIFKWCSQFHQLQWQHWFNTRKLMVWLWPLKWDNVICMDTDSPATLNTANIKDVSHHFTHHAILVLIWAKTNQCTAVLWIEMIKAMMKMVSWEGNHVQPESNFLFPELFTGRDTQTDLMEAGKQRSTT